MSENAKKKAPDDIPPEARQAMAEFFTDLDDPEIQADVSYVELAYTRLDVSRRERLLRYALALMDEKAQDNEIERQREVREALRGSVPVKGGDA